HSTVALPTAALNATAELAGWKSAVHFLDPVGATTVDGGPMPVVIAHRNVVNTACPGAAAYSRLGQIRSLAESARLRYAPHWPELAARYVDAAYETFLGRSADPSGLQFHVQTVTGPSGSREAFTDALAHSDEWINVSLELLYQSALGRSGDAAGMRNWADLIRAGWRLSDVGGQFYGSEEYFSRSGGTPERFVQALYTALLGRAADQAGIDYWAGLLRSGQANTYFIAAGFYASLESRMGRVAGLYQAVLGRGTDPVGQRYWADQLLRIDDVVLAATLAASDEYVRKS
ncbi:MAG: DUF4214 domain-containing protein, partial [Actinomycetota bacterium]|nr:DUF4214 domain-containing protein [Actinomycetota bacterium]